MPVDLDELVSLADRLDRTGLALLAPTVRAAIEEIREARSRPAPPAPVPDLAAVARRIVDKLIPVACEETAERLAREIDPILAGFVTRTDPAPDLAVEAAEIVDDLRVDAHFTRAEKIARVESRLREIAARLSHEARTPAGREERERLGRVAYESVNHGDASRPRGAARVPGPRGILPRGRGRPRRGGAGGAGGDRPASG